MSDRSRSIDKKSDPYCGLPLRHTFGINFIRFDNITCRNNASISNFGGGFRWKSEYPWCIIEVKMNDKPNVIVRFSTKSNLEVEFATTTNQTIDSCEAFHSKLNNLFIASHPNIYNFIDVLKNIQSEINKIIRRNRQKKIPSNCRKRKLNSKKIIEYNNSERSDEYINYFTMISNHSQNHENLQGSVS
ncbi:hypothetical protein AGLY_015502 [Aphis glycines]|uniref:Uncharacterized protein n=1 Tax=Aphis glycines TaxID=307491 RepID=A0A6G0T2K6_APHGL|nr:hypothetical protein AGLY_015502 [Aphis glycines]